MHLQRLPEVNMIGRLKMRDWKMRYGQKWRMENAGVENAGADLI